MNSKTPIDILYTWVDGGDMDYHALLRRYTRERADLNPERFRDKFALLKYSLRSVEKFVPWYRNIYVVTCRPQVPDWLDTSHPNVKIIHHDQIIESKDYLPTFNSHAIESHIHRAPGLSTCFLYLNDDHLFGRETLKSDFMTETGRIKILGTLFGEHPGFRVYQGRFEFVPLGFIEHTPLLVHKKAWQAMQAERPHAEVHRTRQSRFRSDQVLQMDRLYRVFMLSRMKHRSVAVSFYQLVKYHRFHKVTNNLKRQMKGLDRIRRMRPKFYCLNDDQGEHPDESVVKLVRDFLDNYYPDPSPFEKAD